MRDGGTSFFI